MQWRIYLHHWLKVGNNPMLYVPLLCFQHLRINKYPFLNYEYLSKNNCIWIINMHHLTAVSTADLVTGIEHLAFWIYKYHQNSRSSVVNSITPTWVVSLLLCFWPKPQQNAQKIMSLSHEICLQNKFSEKLIWVNNAELRNNICRVHLISRYLSRF